MSRAKEHFEKMNKYTKLIADANDLSEGEVRILTAKLTTYEDFIGFLQQRKKMANKK